jgi:hypothetical protein
MHFVADKRPALPAAKRGVFAAAQVLAGDPYGPGRMVPEINPTPQLQSRFETFCPSNARLCTWADPQPSAPESWLPHHGHARLVLARAWPCWRCPSCG